MADLIDRAVAITRIDSIMPSKTDSDYQKGISVGMAMAKVAITDQPPTPPEIKPIEYRECADAMLKMWMDKVVTDGEYNRIMDKLNAHWGEIQWMI